MRSINCLISDNDFKEKSFDMTNPKLWAQRIKKSIVVLFRIAKTSKAMAPSFEWLLASVGDASKASQVRYAGTIFKSLFSMYKVFKGSVSRSQFDFSVSS